MHECYANTAKQRGWQAAGQTKWANWRAWLSLHNSLAHTPKNVKMGIFPQNQVKSNDKYTQYTAYASSLLSTPLK